MLNRHNLFGEPKVETKASKTNSIAMGIVESDRIARVEKTRRLRAARAERDASEKTPSEAVPEKSSRRNGSPISVAA
jgi:hypothetical protein